MHCTPFFRLLCGFSKASLFPQFNFDLSKPRNYISQIKWLKYYIYGSNEFLSAKNLAIVPTNCWVWKANLPSSPISESPDDVHILERPIGNIKFVFYVLKWASLARRGVPPPRMYKLNLTMEIVAIPWGMEYLQNCTGHTDFVIFYSIFHISLLSFPALGLFLAQ